MPLGASVKPFAANPKSKIQNPKSGMVGERRAVGRSRSGNPGGRSTSEDAGISSEKAGENPARRKPQGSSGRFVLWRLAGPKPKADAVGDGQTVKIPSPDCIVMTEGGTLQQSPSRALVAPGS